VERPPAPQTAPEVRTPLTATAKTVTGGTMTVTFPSVPPGERWYVDRVVITNNSTTATQALMYSGPPSQATYLDSSGAGNRDVGEFDTSHLLHPGDVLTLVWSGVTPPASPLALARLFYRAESL
jgi:hypothetical protein